MRISYGSHECGVVYVFPKQAPSKQQVLIQQTLAGCPPRARLCVGAGHAKVDKVACGHFSPG